jgi:hypothetical protein
MLYVGSVTSTKDRHTAILQDRIDGRGKAGGDGDHFVAWLYGALAQARRGERTEGQQVGRRARVGGEHVFDVQELPQPLFESALKRPLVSQPSSTASTMWRSSPAPITLPAAGMAVLPGGKPAVAHVSCAWRSTRSRISFLSCVSWSCDDECSLQPGNSG